MLCGSRVTEVKRVPRSDARSPQPRVRLSCRQSTPPAPHRVSVDESPRNPCREAASASRPSRRARRTGHPSVQHTALRDQRGRDVRPRDRLRAAAASAAGAAHVVGGYRIRFARRPQPLVLVAHVREPHRLLRPESRHERAATHYQGMRYAFAVYGRTSRGGHLVLSLRGLPPMAVLDTRGAPDRRP